MKRFTCLCLVLFFIGVLFAQNQSRVYLFEKYTNGKVLMHTRAIAPAFLNYDVANCNMMYMEDKKEMILENIQSIDTVFIGGNKFIPVGNKGFLDVVNLKNGTVYIYWKLTSHFVGKKGAYGQIVQGTVETVNMNMVKQQAGNESRHQNVTDVYARRNENEYWLLRNGKFAKCKNEKSLLKLFPGKEEEIKIFMEEHKFNFSNTQQALEIIDFCLKTHKQH